MLPSKRVGRLDFSGGIEHGYRTFQTIPGARQIVFDFSNSLHPAIFWGINAKFLDRHPLTYEEERGKPPPTENHGAIQANLGVEFGKCRKFRTLSEVTLELVPGTKLTPDLSVEPRTPLDLLRDTITLMVPPLITAEIVLPSQGLAEVIDRIQFYLANGVRSVWMVLPPLHQVTIFLPDGSQQTHHRGIVRDPATGITVDLDAVFS